MIVDKERQSLLPAGLEHHERAAGARHVNDMAPESRTDPGAHMSNVDSSGDLEQPLCQVTSEARRARREDDDRHQKSTSALSA